MKHLVIGLGEVGSALQQVLNCEGYDVKDNPIPTKLADSEVLHICFPWSKTFEKDVEGYRKAFTKTKHVVIHSTVPIGTSRKLGALHSPVRGKHPNLAVSLQTFTKYVGHIGDLDAAAEVADEMISHGIAAFGGHDSLTAENTEAGKLIDLMQYGVSILLVKEIKKFCDENKLDFEIVYSQFNRSYNEGFKEMGFEMFTRPILVDQPGKIGGHCVVQMMDILDSPSAKKIIKENKAL